MNNYQEQFQHLFTIDGLISLLTLTVLEIVLGIDNIIFVSIVASKLEDKKEQRTARFTGLLMAMFIRIGLLFAIGWILTLDQPLFTVFGNGFTGKDIILFGGGVFLLIKTVSEIHQRIEGEEEDEEEKRKKKKVKDALFAVIMQIVFIDIIFSFDSILTAVGVVNNVIIMIAAVIVSMVLMMIASEKVSEFIERHPTMKMLALAFLLMIGVLLVAEAFHREIPKQYVYCSMGFAFLVEFLNMRARKNAGKK
ncbi:MAG TPA: TerC family protein [Bacteroidia bacterium]